MPSVLSLLCFVILAGGLVCFRQADTGEVMTGEQGPERTTEDRGQHTGQHTETVANSRDIGLKDKTGWTGTVARAWSERKKARANG